MYKYKKKIALLKGPGNKSYIGYLFLHFFAYGGLPGGKKFCIFEQHLALKQKIYLTFDGRKLLALSKIFPAKRLVYFWINIRHYSKSRLFFHGQIFPTNIPTKFLRTETCFLDFLESTSFLNIRSVTIIYFPYVHLQFN